MHYFLRLKIGHLLLEIYKIEFKKYIHTNIKYRVLMYKFMTYKVFYF